MFLLRNKFPHIFIQSRLPDDRHLIVSFIRFTQDKFNKLLAVLPDIHEVATRGEEHLYQKHCNGSAPTQTLLMEMLHAKRK